MKKRIYLVLATALLLTLVLAPTMTGCSTPERGMQEGITVHGDWTIDVKNADGTLVEHREFKNALAPGGDNFLSGLLARQTSLGGWIILLMATNDSDSAFIDGPSPGAGAIAESTWPTTQANFFKTMTVSQGDGTQLVLSGTATAQRDGQIDIVATTNYVPDATFAPSNDYTNGSQSYLTTTTLGTPVQLTNGQQVNVTVVISFS